MIVQLNGTFGAGKPTTARELVTGDDGVAVGRDVTREPFGLLSAFRAELYASMTWRADALFVLTDAMVCAEPGAGRRGGRVRTRESPAPVRGAGFSGREVP